MPARPWSRTPSPLVRPALAVLALAASSAVAQDPRPPESAPRTGSVIFIHPDGTSASTWAAARALYYGPDGMLNWDRLPDMALYRGHMADSLTATSNGGGTTHAYGRKVGSGAYGLSEGGERGEPIVDGNGESLSVARQAVAAGLPVALVQSGSATEPGTGCFLASVPNREMHDAIAAQLLESGAEILLGGGEQYFLPKGTFGVHGEGVRTDGRNLIEEAQEDGFVVVRTRRELLELPVDTSRVLGLFARHHTFTDKSEEILAATGRPPFDPGAPTIGEMTRKALQLLDGRGTPFLLIAEEEATDNFGNHNNASGMLEAMRRADDAIGIAYRYVNEHPDTLLLTASDSDAGGMRMIGRPTPSLREPNMHPLPAWSHNGAPIDGANGTGTKPFLAQPDRAGRRLPFFVSWSAHRDVSGGILVRAYGLHSERVRGSFDNTGITDLIRLTLFGPAGRP